MRRKPRLLIALVLFGRHRQPIPILSPIDRMAFTCLRVVTGPREERESNDSASACAFLLDSARSMNPRAPGGMRTLRRLGVDTPPEFMRDWWGVARDTLFLGGGYGYGGHEVRLALTVDTLAGSIRGRPHDAPSWVASAWAVRIPCARPDDAWRLMAVLG